MIEPDYDYRDDVREQDEAHEYREYRQPSRHRYSCADRMCGADDCERCRPGCTINTEEDEE